MEFSGTIQEEIRFPPAVEPGDAVGIAALSGPVDGTALAAGVDQLRRLGFRPVLADNLTDRSVGLFAGDDESRLRAFHRLAANDALRAIFFARGGYGILRVLPAIDWNLLRQYPRAYVGYSDVTPFLNAVVSRLRWVALHGPMVAVDLARGLDELERRSLLTCLAGQVPDGIEIAGHGSPAEGRLLGGCLSMLTATLGTAFAASFDDAVLFWEDVDEPLYRLDRMLTQLRLSGSLNRLQAMVVGRVEPSDTVDEHGDLSDHLLRWAAETDCSLAYGVPSGHCIPNLTLPLGSTVRLDPEVGRLSFIQKP